MAFKSKQSLFLLIVIIILSILAFSAFGFFYGRSTVVCEVCPPEEVDFSLLWEAWDKIEENYVDKEKLDTQEMIYGAISGMLESLGDPYTVFFKPEDAKRFIEDNKGVFEGVGMEIGIRNGQLQVIAPLEGTPAQEAGLRAGDKILQVNGLSTLDMAIEEVVNLIRGPKGTEVTLTVFRNGWPESKEIKIIRGTIEIPSLKLEIIEGNIAFLNIYQFSEKSASDFKEAAIEILESPAEKIILDLRNNPGGYLLVVQDMAGWFLERGQVVAIEDFGGGKEQKEYKAYGNSKLLPYPIVILINQGSASGSEILAGALRDNRNVKIIGQSSFGKGSVQELKDLQDGSSLKITIAKWLTPKGESITDKGLEPDIEVEMTEEDYQEGRDPQLDKAIEIIKGL